MNRFLTLLISGYYDQYVLEKKKLHDKAVAALKDFRIDGHEKERIAQSILDAITESGAKKTYEKSGRTLSFKPTAKTEDLIKSIERNSCDSPSRYLKGMLTDYSKKPFSQREQIVFHDHYSLLLRCCADRQPIRLSTIWEKDTTHEVVPYAVATGPEEMFNYLLCQEVNPSTHIPETRAYSLRRIRGISASDISATISPHIHERLERMISMGPQYAINDEDEICVRLTEKGLAQFNSIYFGRPKYRIMEHKPDGHYQYYRCSHDQAFLYFRRFDAKEAEILAPDSLRKRMACFFREGADVYKML